MHKPGDIFRFQPKELSPDRAYLEKVVGTDWMLTAITSPSITGEPHFGIALVGIPRGHDGYEKKYQGCCQCTPARNRHNINISDEEFLGCTGKRTRLDEWIKVERTVGQTSLFRG